jgi:GntR family transcriptional regulator / MocR family aminotransferase
MGVRVNGLDQYRFAADTQVDLDPRPPALVLGFGNVSEHQISRGIDKLAKAVRQV